MTAVEMPTTAPPRREVAVPLTRLIGVEGRKQLDTRAGRWLLITIAVVTAIVMAVLLFVNGGKHSFRELLLATVTPQALLLPIVGILAVTSEWSQRAALVTFTLEPRRGRVAAAKTISALLVAVIALAAAVALAALAHLASIAFRGAQAGWSVPTPVLAGFALVLLLGVAQGVGFGMLLLNTPAAIVTYLVLPTRLERPGRHGRLTQDRCGLAGPHHDDAATAPGKHDRQPVAAPGHCNGSVGAAAASGRDLADHPLRGEVADLSDAPGGGYAGDPPAYPPPDRLSANPATGCRAPASAGVVGNGRNDLPDRKPPTRRAPRRYRSRTRSGPCRGSG